ncbi:MAG: YigZ family protein [Bifidobacterium psychraerophilum]
MFTILDPVDAPAESELEEKRSRFIGNCCHIRSAEEVAAFVAAMRERHPKARHIAYAAMWGEREAIQSERMSDDGEPSGTAGKPILDCIRQQDLIDCVITVTRYFGGILLGSGGLIRAYSSAASSAVQHSSIAELTPCREYRFALTYPQLDICKRLVADHQGDFKVLEYSDHVEVQATIPFSRDASFQERMIQGFNAQVVLRESGQVNMPVTVSTRVA